MSLSLLPYVLTLLLLAQFPRCTIAAGISTYAVAVLPEIHHPGGLFLRKRTQYCKSRYNVLPITSRTHSPREKLKARCSSIDSGIESLLPRDSVKKDAILAVPRSHCFNVITNFEEYPKWTGAVSKATILEYDDLGRGKVVAYEAGAFGLTASYTLSYTYGGQHTLAWESIAGSIKKIVGAYDLEDKNETTKVTYTLGVDLGFYLPSYLKRSVTKLIISVALGELRRFSENTLGEFTVKNAEAMKEVKHDDDSENEMDADHNLATYKRNSETEEAKHDGVPMEESVLKISSDTSDNLADASCPEIPIVEKSDVEPKEPIQKPESRHDERIHRVRKRDRVRTWIRGVRQRFSIRRTGS